MSGPSVMLKRCAAIGPPGLVDDAAGDRGGSSGDDRQADAGHLLSKRHVYRLGSCQRRDPGIKRGPVSEWLVGKLADPRVALARHDVVVAWREPREPELADVVRDGICRHEWRPSPVSKALTRRQDPHLIHSLAGIVDHHAGNARRGWKDDVDAGQPFSCPELDSPSCLERAALSVLEREVARLGSGDGIASGWKVGEGVASLQISPDRESSRKSPCAEAHDRTTKRRFAVSTQHAAADRAAMRTDGARHIARRLLRARNNQGEQQRHHRGRTFSVTVGACPSCSVRLVASGRRRWRNSRSSH